eukprot:ANDGO_06794.mRNA.1 hypothetical protein
MSQSRKRPASDTDVLDEDDDFFSGLQNVPDEPSEEKKAKAPRAPKRSKKSEKTEGGVEKRYVPDSELVPPEPYDPDSRPDVSELFPNPEEYAKTMALSALEREFAVYERFEQVNEKRRNDMYEYIADKKGYIEKKRKELGLEAPPTDDKTASAKKKSGKTAQRKKKIVDEEEVEDAEDEEFGDSADEGGGADDQDDDDYEEEEYGKKSSKKKGGPAKGGKASKKRSLDIDDDEDLQEYVDRKKRQRQKHEYELDNESEEEEDDEEDDEEAGYRKKVRHVDSSLLDAEEKYVNVFLQEDAQNLQLIRKDLLQWQNSTFFEDSEFLPGFFVRFADFLKNDRRIYGFGRILSVERGEEYVIVLDDRKSTVSDKFLNVEIGQRKTRLRLDQVSNSPVQSAELKYFKQEEEKAGHVAPTQAFIRRKMAQRKEVPTHEVEQKSNQPESLYTKTLDEVKNFAAEKLKRERERNIAMELGDKAKVAELDHYIERIAQALKTRQDGQSRNLSSIAITSSNIAAAQSGVGAVLLKARQEKGNAFNLGEVSDAVAKVMGVGLGKERKPASQIVVHVDLSRLRDRDHLY